MVKSKGLMVFYPSLRPAAEAGPSRPSLPSRMIRQEFLDLSGEQYMQYELKIWGFSEIEDIMDIMAMSCESMSLGNSICSSNWLSIFWPIWMPIALNRSLRTLRPIG